MAKRRVERRKSVGKNRADFGMKAGSEEGRERKSKREKAGWKEEQWTEESKQQIQRIPQLV